ncbi:MAG: hypothetical protein NWF00_06790 [Candidatus Bathyarchaeota archaeon]|nr:hypothetical protein [Candidatus Bathyarchaeota archaeon]
MKTLKQTKYILLSAILILTIAVPLVALPDAIAHDPAWTIPTWCYVAVTNNPIGIDQQMDIVFWLNAYPPTANGAYGDRWTFNVEVTKPDGSTTTIGPLTSDPVGTGYAHFTPDQIGEYTVVAKFAGATITGEPFPPDWTPFSFGSDSIGDIYEASASDPVKFTTQQEKVSQWQEPPLPTQILGSSS